MARPDKYSSLPWPKGCSRSAGILAILKPAKVTTEDPASDRLLKASAVIAIEPVKKPAKNLLQNKQRFKRIPIPPANMPYLPRTTGSLIFWLSGMNKRIKKFTMQSPFWYIKSLSVPF